MPGSDERQTAGRVYVYAHGSRPGEPFTGTSTGTGTGMWSRPYGFAQRYMFARPCVLVPIHVPLPVVGQRGRDSWA